MKATTLAAAAMLMLAATSCHVMKQTDNNPGVAVATTSMTFPRPLKPGDKVAIVSPASAVNPVRVDTLVNLFRSWGYVPVEGPNARLRHGSYSAPDSARAAELNMFFADPEIRAIICTRGGHGSIHTLQYLDRDAIQADPKWLLGFSDISTLHAYLNRAGVASIHGPMYDMVKHPLDSCTLMTKHILEHGLPVTMQFAASDLNRHGKGTGRLYGGNLITFDELAETPVDIFPGHIDSPEGMILYVEEIEENVYAIERLMWRLHASGKLKQLNGLIFGYFTRCNGDADFDTTEQMLRKRLEEWGYYDKASTMPIVYHIPIGHEMPNYPMVNGSLTTLVSTPQGVTITMAE